MTRRIKRLLDIALALTGLLVLAPLLAAVGVAIRLTSGSPVLFRQVRSGYLARPFVLLKFRTMREAYGSDGRPIDDAERLTQLGRFLRAMSLDELPQLWNVLRGDMSLVGPRPLLMEYLPLYSPEQARRHEVRPGITGWAQVNGRSSIEREERLKYDVWYVDHWSLWLDLLILGMTPIKILIHRGFCPSGHMGPEEDDWGGAGRSPGRAAAPGALRETPSTAG
ncbi:MAG TPA: sugar transferase [Isosphaeraceae bacterium]|nr:sugar transferase [Isosphaeraceae bacterium]